MTSRGMEVTKVTKEVVNEKSKDPPRQRKPGWGTLVWISVETQEHGVGHPPDKKLIAKLGRSTQRAQVRHFDEFVSNGRG